MGIIILFVSFISVGTSFFCLDYLLKYQFQNHKELWIEDGEPTFFGGRPKGLNDMTFSSQISGWACSLALVFSNPSWIKVDKRLRKIALVYRIGVILFWIIWLFQVTIMFKK